MTQINVPLRAVEVQENTQVQIKEVGWRRRKAEGVTRGMYSFLKIFIVVVLALALIDWLADRDRRADTNIPNATPGWALLAGDIKPNATSGGRFFQATSK